MDPGDQDDRRLSTTIKTLDQRIKLRYTEKIDDAGIADPYMMPKGMFVSLLSMKQLPDFQYADIYNYFVESTSSFTRSAMKAYKSLEAYKYFIAGWVRDIDCRKIEKAYLFMSKVGPNCVTHPPPFHP